MHDSTSGRIAAEPGESNCRHVYYHDETIDASLYCRKTRLLQPYECKKVRIKLSNLPIALGRA